MAVGSFSQGLAGLNAFSSWLGVIGNNLANINTIGYKASTVSFQDLVSQSVSGTSSNPMQVGLGVIMGQISPVFSQGAIETTRESTNAAIQGGGFFVVNGTAGESYTRAGNFSFNSAGVLVTTDGLRVQGWTPGATGVIVATGPTGDITVTPGALRAPVATTQFQTLSNLNVAAAVPTATDYTVASITSVATVATATITAHGWPVGATRELIIAGATPAAYNGTYIATVTGVNTLTYTFGGNGGVAAAGTITGTVPSTAAATALVTGITSVATVATATIPTHGWGAAGVTREVIITGSTQTAYNGTYTATVVDANTVTYTFAGNGGVAAAGTIVATAPGTAAPAGSTFTTSIQTYDAKGDPHVMSVTYTRTAAGWDFQNVIAGTDVVAGAIDVNGFPRAAGTPFTIIKGSITFDSEGKMATIIPMAPVATSTVAAAIGGSVVPATTPPTFVDVSVVTPAWSNGAAASTLSWDIVNAAGTTALTGFAAASATSSISQNGGPAGMLDNLTVSADGTINATFGSGQSVAVGQLALANFNNPKGLLKQGSNRYTQSQSAGTANIGTAGTGGRGTLIGSAVEGSNVDIAQEFTSMILAQRGYQANSKTITTSDEMLIETLNLKR